MADWKKLSEFPVYVGAAVLVILHLLFHWIAMSWFMLDAQMAVYFVSFMLFVTWVAYEVFVKD